MTLLHRIFTHSSILSRRHEIPGVTYSATANYSEEIHYLEHVIVKISVAIPMNHVNLKRGDLQIELTSPSGTLSVLLHPRPFDDKPSEYVDWPFMSVMFWGENPTGQWTLNIRTGDVTGVAVVSRVEFQFYGVSRVQCQRQWQTFLSSVILTAAEGVLERAPTSVTHVSTSAMRIHWSV